MFTVCEFSQINLLANLWTEPVNKSVSSSQINRHWMQPTFSVNFSQILSQNSQIFAHRIAHRFVHRIHRCLLTEFTDLYSTEICEGFIIHTLNQHVWSWVTEIWNDWNSNWIHHLLISICMPMHMHRTKTIIGTLNDIEIMIKSHAIDIAVVSCLLCLVYCCSLLLLSWNSSYCCCCCCCWGVETRSWSRGSAVCMRVMISFRGEH
jgi:hypothetical protein